ncbi:RsmB/NOP family class I SAM-dependent RNA methyltransferase [Candidatus Micrarchaeota archaeon]|nr:RsmB/NOP family class I SAM-dependent RNA methyltransferase [Candidatus Micrarchaeota archaeon]
MELNEFKEWLASYTDADRCLEAFYNQKEFFRVNTIKTPVEKFLEITKLKCDQSKYCTEAFELKEEENYAIGKTWEYFLGYIYPQSLSSILVSLVLGPKSDNIILDVAAAPGSKFSHIAALMQNNRLLVGNDLKKEKISALYSTINRLNILNCITTIRDGSRLNWRERFDKVLLDAPCTALGSGEGALNRWTLDHSKKISTLQKRMLFSAFDALKPGGELIYSTCTYAKEENEEVVSNLLQNVQSAKLLDIKLDIPHDSGLSEYGNEFRKCYRIYPQHLQSEGFFIAKIGKGD